MGLTPLAFTGVSSFSQDFQTILTRAESIAALPLQALQNQKTDLIQRKTLTGTLESVMANFTSSLEALATVGDAAGMSGSSSNSSKVAINSVTATTPATYTISDITSIATAASETTASGYATTTSTAVSATGALKLTFGSTDYNINLTPSENNLAGLRDAINDLGAGVTASILTTGTGSDPNYLLLTSNATGATTLQLVDDPTGAATNILTSANQGSNADFKLNGVTVSKASNLINDVVSGATFTIAGTTTGSETVTLQLASDRSKLSTALSSLASAYNSIVDFIDSQIGENAGLLSGSNLIREASSVLRQLVNFNGAGSVKSLSQLGMVLDDKGKLTFDSATFNQLSASDVSNAYVFAGTSSDGLGSLLASFRSVSDPVNGVLKLEQDQHGRTEDRLNTQISELTERITAQQNALRTRLQAADTLLAGLESQKSLLNAAIEGLNLTLYGKKEG